MDTQAVLNFLIELLAYAPQLANGGQDVITGITNIWNGLTQDTAPTEAQMNQYQTALDQAHQALQNS